MYIPASIKIMPKTIRAIFHNLFITYLQIIVVDYILSRAYIPCPLHLQGLSVYSFCLNTGTPSDDTFRPFLLCTPLLIVCLPLSVAQTW